MCNEVWRIVEQILAHYLTHHPKYCQGHVLEVGSGTGLAGIVVGKLSSTPELVVLSDNNPYVLNLLQTNIDQNFINCSGKYYNSVQIYNLIQHCLYVFR